jgi:peptidoglycan/LPS O-acetylase OafA/YrhL
VQKLLRCRPLVGIGRLSYGIYLLHLLAMAVVYRFVPASQMGLAGSILVYLLTALLSMAWAWVMYRTLESFGINLGRRWSQRIIERAADRSAQKTARESGNLPWIRLPACSCPVVSADASSGDAAKSIAPDNNGSCVPAPS